MQQSAKINVLTANDVSNCNRVGVKPTVAIICPLQTNYIVNHFNEEAMNFFIGVIRSKIGFHTAKI